MATIIFFSFSQPEMFALLLIQDHELPRSFYEPIVQSMKTQITLFTNMSEIEMPPRRAVIKVEVRVGKLFCQL